MKCFQSFENNNLHVSLKKKLQRNISPVLYLFEGRADIGLIWSI